MIGVADDAGVMRLWRECGLPEYFLGNGGTNRKLVALAERIRDEALEEAALACERRRDKTGPQEAYAVLDVESYMSACGGCAFDIRALKDKP